MGLASAKKLASHGMNLFIVHRDRRGSMPQIELEFEAIRTQGVRLITLNADATGSEGRHSILNQFAEDLGNDKISLLLHSIALGNLKPAAPQMPQGETKLELLAEASGIDSRQLELAMKSLLAQGHQEFAELLGEDRGIISDTLLDEEDFAQTIHNMGTSLMFWVQDLHQRKMFAGDSRVLGLTSQGNQIAWQGYAAVSAAKCALEAVARSIAREFAVHGIRCNVLQPGITDTPALRLIPGSKQMKYQAIERNPFSRLTTVEDVANVVYLMSLKEAAWINGAILRVDGGEAISH
ncbi:MAG: SDR family oxidoreductase [Oligoflexus sp.]|nr:SDR family oxidoreductase [Oligoflexus sp.]